MTEVIFNTFETAFVTGSIPLKLITGQWYEEISYILDIHKKKNITIH